MSTLCPQPGNRFVSFVRASGRGEAKLRGRARGDHPSAARVISLRLVTASSPTGRERRDNPRISRTLHLLHLSFLSSQNFPLEKCEKYALCIFISVFSVFIVVKNCETIVKSL